MAKKNKKVDFQKVKLKPGRKLKRTNESTLNFKSKKIVLREQFRDVVSAAESRELKPDVAYVIKLLNHSNFRERWKAVKKLQEMLEGDELTGRLNVVIPAVLPLLVDANYDVRQRALQLAKSVFQVLSSDHARGYMNRIKTYVSLAMTHINPDIRSDSLQIFDFFLDQFPDFVSSSESLIHQFLDLVSLRKQEKGHRSLHVLGIASGITAQQWRLNVLERLIKLFEVNIAKMSCKETPEAKNEFVIPKGTIHVVKHFSYKTTLSLDTEEFDETSLVNNPDCLLTLLNDVIEILVRSWDEAVSGLYSRSNKSRFSSDCKENGSMIAVIVKCLYNCAVWINILEKRECFKKVISTFKQLIGGMVQSTFFTCFPIDINIDQSSQISLETSSFVELNLYMCKIFVTFVLDTAECSSIFAIRVLDFLLDQAEKLDASCMPLVIETLKCFLMCDNVDIALCHPHLEAIFNAARQVNADVKLRKQVSEFFLDLVLDPKYWNVHSVPIVHAFLEWLPGEFLCTVECGGSIDQSYETFIHRVMKIPPACHPSFAEGLQNASCELLNLLMSSDEIVRYAGVVLSSRIPNWYDYHFCKLFNLCKNLSIPASVLCKLIMRLNCRFHKGCNAGFSSVSFKSFLLNLAVGINANSEDSIVKEEGRICTAVAQAMPLKLSSYKVLPSKRYERHAELFNLALDMLSHMDSKYFVTFSTRSFLVTFLQKVHCMPAFTAVSILKLFGSLVLGYPPNDQEYSLLCGRIADLTIAAYLYEASLVKVDCSKEFLGTHSILSTLHQHTNNFGEITKVMLSKLDVIECMNDTVHYGNILCEMKKCCPLAKEDAPKLSSLLNGMLTIFGNDVQGLDWWIKLRDGAA